MIVSRQGQRFERLPAYIRRAPLDEKTNRLCGQIWMPDEPYQWTDQGFSSKKNAKVPMIYEAHVGMAQDKYGVGTYLEFAENVLTRVKFNENKPLIYYEALKGDENLDGIDNESIFGFHVDAGLATIVDVETRDKYCDFVDKWYQENPEKNIYDD